MYMMHPVNPPNRSHIIVRRMLGRLSRVAEYLEAQVLCIWFTECLINKGFTHWGRIPAFHLRYGVYGVYRV